MNPQLQAFQIAMLQTEYGDFGSQPPSRSGLIFSRALTCR